MSSILPAVGISGALLLSIFGSIEFGYRIGRKKRHDDPDAVSRGIGGIDAAIFGLLGLLIAFIFGGASVRFENRRQLIITESNAISTAYLRLDLLPDADRVELQRLCRDYLDARIALHRTLHDGDDDPSVWQHEPELQQAIWTAANASLRRQNSPTTSQLLVPALNDMFNAAGARIASTKLHAPSTIVTLLVAMVLLGSMLAGFGMSARPERARLHTWVFALAMTATVYVTLDLDLPRSGLIRVDTMDRVLVDLRKSM